MLTSKSAFEASSVSPVAITTRQEVQPATTPERQREFETILSNGLPRFRKIAMRSLGNAEDAEDAVQDAMLSACKHVSGFDGRAQMSTWLTKIVINAARMQLRRRLRRQILSLDESPKEGQSGTSDFLRDPNPTPERLLEQCELRELVSKLISQLPPSQKATLQLHQRDDFSIRMAAETLGVPEGTIKAQLTRGRANLAERFHHATRRTKGQTTSSKSATSRQTRSSHYRKDSVSSRSDLPIFVLQQCEGGREGWVAQS